MIQQLPSPESQNPIDHLFQEIAMYVQHDDHLKQIFINLGQELARGIAEPNRSLPAIETEVPVPKYSTEQIDQMIGDLIHIVSNQLELSDKARMCSIGEEFISKHVGLCWTDIGFRSLSCALEIHLPECYMLSPCRNFVTKAADLSKLDLDNGIGSAGTIEVKPLKKSSVKNKPSKMKASQKTKRPKGFSSQVLEVRDLLSNIQRITFAGQGPKGARRPKQYKEALDVEVSWIQSTKKSSHKRFVEKVLTTQPQLVVQSKLGIGKQESRLLKKNCKKQGIPYVIVPSISGVDTVALRIMEQVSDQILNRNV